MTRQLATLLTSGIPMIEALSALVEQMDNEQLQVALSSVKEKVNEGASLAQAMKAHPKIFSELYVNMVAAGEASGALDIVLERLAEFQEDQVELQNRVRGAMAYPVIMTVIGSGMVIFLVSFIIPMFEKMFRQMGVDLPMITRFLLWTSRFIGDWWLLLLLLAGGVAYGFVAWKASEAGRPVWDRVRLRAPVFGKTERMLAVTRFSRTLATLLASGVPLIQALTIVEAILGNSVLKEAVESTRNSVQEGSSIADPLKRSGQFPPIMTRMIATGEKTGELERMLEKVADSYESQVKRRIDLMTAFLQPVMIVLMAVAVGFIALSILLPMLRTYSMVRGG
jgi:general secretion pathway protein F